MNDKDQLEQTDAETDLVSSLYRICILIVIVVFIYVFSTGPAIWIAYRLDLSPEFLNTFYKPLEGLVEKSETFEAFIYWYINLFYYD